MTAHDEARRPMAEPTITDAAREAARRALARVDWPSDAFTPLVAQRMADAAVDAAAPLILRAAAAGRTPTASIWDRAYRDAIGAAYLGDLADALTDTAERFDVRDPVTGRRREWRIGARAGIRMAAAHAHAAAAQAGSGQASTRGAAK